MYDICYTCIKASEEERGSKMITNTNIKHSAPTFIDPTEELNNKLNEFDSVITKTFGDEVVSISHRLWSENTSFTSVEFVNGDFIDFRVSSKRVIDDTYTANKEHLRKALRAFGIELPFWMTH
jgi:hypothetical protein